LSAPYPNLEIFPSTGALFKAAAEFMITLGKEAIADRGRFVVSLAGGATPRKLYSLLAQPVYAGRMDWNKIHFFWGDERCVPLNDQQNNAYHAILLLLNKIDIPQNNIHRIPVNLSPSEAASEYDKEVKDFFYDGAPVFDLILLGLGMDGHTASLFPGTKILDEQKPGIKTVYLEDQKSYRITMTIPLINLARQIIFMVTGNGKAEIIKAVFSEDLRYPAQFIKPVNGELRWFIDKDAAGSLNH